MNIFDQFDAPLEVAPTDGPWYKGAGIPGVRAPNGDPMYDAEHPPSVQSGSPHGKLLPNYRKKVTLGNPVIGVGADALAPGTIPKPTNPFDQFDLQPASLSDYPKEFGKSMAKAAVQTVGDTLRGAAILTTDDPNKVHTVEDGIAKLKTMTPEQATDFVRSIPHYMDINPVSAFNYQRAARALWKGDQKAADEFLKTARGELATTPLKEQKVYKAGQSVDQSVAGPGFAPKPGWEDSWTAALGQGLGSTAGFIPIGLTTGGLGVAALGGSIGAAQQYDQGVQSAKEPGSALAGMKPEDAQKMVMRAAKMGFAPGASEDVPIELLINQTAGRIPWLRPFAGSPLMAKLVKTAGRVLGQAAAEGGQEYGQQVGQNFINQLMVNPRQDLTEGAWHNALIGALTGGAMQGVHETYAALHPASEQPPPGNPPPQQERIEPTFPGGPGPGGSASPVPLPGLTLPPDAEGGNAPVDVAPLPGTAPLAPRQQPVAPQPMPVTPEPAPVAPPMVAVTAPQGEPGTPAGNVFDQFDETVQQSADVSRRNIPIPEVVSGVRNQAQPQGQHVQSLPQPSIQEGQTATGAPQEGQPQPLQGPVGGQQPIQAPSVQPQQQAPQATAQPTAIAPVTVEALRARYKPQQLNQAQVDLFGKVLGTKNLKPEQLAALDRHLGGAENVQNVQTVQPQAPVPLTDAHIGALNAFLGSKQSITPENLATRAKVDAPTASRLIQHAIMRGTIIQTRKGGLMRAPVRVKPLNVLEAIASYGGIRDDGGELKARGLTGSNTMTPYGPFVRPSGLPPDTIRERLVEDGFIHEPGNVTNGLAQTTPEHVYALIDQAVAGKPVYSAQDQAVGDALAAEKKNAMANPDAVAQHPTVVRHGPEVHANIMEALSEAGLTEDDWTPFEIARVAQLVAKGMDAGDAFERVTVEDATHDIAEIDQFIPGFDIPRATRNPATRDAFESPPFETKDIPHAVDTTAAPRQGQGLVEPGGTGQEPARQGGAEPQGQAVQGTGEIGGQTEAAPAAKPENLPAVVKPTGLFVQIGKRRFEMTSYKQASEALRKMLDETGATFSGETGPQAPRPLIVDAQGNQIGYISQNGRVWAGDPMGDNNKLLYDPRQEPAPTSEPGAEGKPQSVLPGAEAKTEAEAKAAVKREEAAKLLVVKSKQSMLRKGGQQEAGGMFAPPPEKGLFEEPAPQPKGEAIPPATVSEKAPVSSTAPKQAPLASLARPQETFYSGLIRATENLKQNTAPPAQWLATIKNQPGVKPEEIAWLGLPEWLAEQKGNVTKTQLLDFLRANQVQVREVVHERKIPFDGKIFTDIEEAKQFLRDTGIDPENDYGYTDERHYVRLANNRVLEASPTDTTKFASYQLPSGENYRELLLTLPSINMGPISKEFANFLDRMSAKYPSYRSPTEWSSVDQNELARIRDAGDKEPSGPQFRSGHFDEPNVVAHVRFNERTDAAGKKTLFIEEIQSDWMQKGRKHGFRKTPEAIAALDAKAKQVLKEKIDPYAKFVRAQLLENGAIDLESLTNSDVSHWESQGAISPDDASVIHAAIDAHEAQGHTVPDAPFKTTWHELALKRMIRYAAENGFDSVSWTPGSVQAERYDLSKHIDHLKWYRDGDGYRISAAKDGQIILQRTGLSAPELADNVGKELAEKIHVSTEQHGVLSGLNLKVGGEGMAGFYDKILVDTANKLGKKFGAKVGRTTIPAKQEGRAFTTAEPIMAPVAVHTLPITDAMRESVMQGQPLFQKPKQQEKSPSGWDKVSGGGGNFPKYWAGISDKQRAEETAKITAMVEKIIGRRINVRVGDTSAGGWQGLYQGDSRAIFIALRQAHSTTETTAHELIHALRDLGILNNSEWAVLKREASERIYWNGQSMLDSARADYADFYGKTMDLTEDQMNEIFAEEAVARLFGSYMDGRLPQTSATGKRLLDRIFYVLEALHNWLKGHGFQSAEGIMKKIAAGKMASRRESEGPGRGFVVKAKDQSAAKQASLANIVPAPRNPLPGSFDMPPDEHVMRVLSDSTDTLLGRLGRAKKALGPAIRRKMQDREIDWKRVEAAIKGTGTVIPENQDVYQAMSVYPGQAAQVDKDLVDDIIKPWVQETHDRSLTLQDVDDFNDARHALERNQEIGKIHPPGSQFHEAMTNDAIVGGSGMSNDEAAAILDRFQNSGRYADVETMGNKVVALNKRMLQWKLAEGLITQDTYDALTKKYQYYVPLRGFADPVDNEKPDHPHIGRRYDIKGKEVRQAFGRRSRADSSSAYSFVQAREAFTRIAKNRVGKTALRLAQANPNQAIWEIKPVRMKKTIDPSTGFVKEVRDPTTTLADNAFHTKVDGKSYDIVIHHPGLLEAIKGFGNEGMSEILVLMHKVMRFFSAINTGWSPEFLLTNFFRDIQEGGINLAEEKIKGLTTRVIKGIPKAVIGMNAMLKGETNTQWSQHAREFADSGGMVGYLTRADVATQKADLDRLFKDMAPSAPRKVYLAAAEQVGKRIERYNNSIENGIRLSTYVHLRQAGYSKGKAAMAAKELTINFNRKGEWSPAFNAFYMFFNARAQGAANLSMRLARSPRMRKIAGSIVLFALMQGLLNHWLAGDDDDDKNRYDKIDDQVKQRNFIIMLPKGYAVPYIKFPLPPGYGMFHIMGTQLAEMFTSSRTPLEGAANIASGVAGSYNPLSMGSDFVGAMIGLVPTMGQPLMQIAANRDYFGQKVVPDSYDHTKPMSQRYYPTSSPAAVGAAGWLNSMTGGNEVRSGAIDLAPAWFQQMWDFGTGGLGKLVSRASTVAGQITRGEGLDPSQVPFTRVFAGQSSKYSDRDAYRTMVDQVDVAKNEIKMFQQKHDPEALAAARKDHARELALQGVFQGAEKQLATLRKLQNSTDNQPSLTPAERRKKIQDLQERKDHIMLIARKRWNDYQPPAAP